MAHKTDMAKARQKYEEEKERAARQASFGRRADWWKPSAGTSKIRILPPWTDEGPNRNQWWREVWMHYGVTSLEEPDDENAFAVACPRKSPDGKEVVGEGEVPDCKICKLVEELRATGNPADAEAAKKLKAKMRVYINMIDMSDPVWTEDDITTKKANGVPEDQLPTAGGPKVQVYNFGPIIFKGLLDAYSDDVDLSDLDEGHDVVIEREGEGLKTKYRVRAQFKATAAPIKDEELDENIWNMDQLVTYFTDEQVDLILQGGTREDVYALNAPEEAPALPPKKEETKKAPPKKAKKEEPAEEPADEDQDDGDEPPADEDQDDEPTDESLLDADSLPLDSDGDIIFDELTDEQIENPANSEIMITNNEGAEYGPHVACFGNEAEHNPKDKACRDDCFLFERCGKRIEFKKEEAAKAEAAAAAAKKKGAPGKGGKPAGKAAPGKSKPKAGKGNGQSSKPAATKTEALATDPSDLEKKMLEAMGKG